MNTDALFQRAKQLIPGGVNSPVRAFQSVGMTPLFIQKGKGGHIWDIEGHSYIDYLQSWGALILGHANAELVDAITEACKNGTSFGAVTLAELELAELIVDSVPSIEKLRMVNSGTEATMSAIRLARAYTNREKIIKFEGCYHGHADSFLIQAGSGALTSGVPNSKGVSLATARDTLVAQFNDIETVKALISQHKGTIAALIIEPVCGNMGCIPPREGFLNEVQALCKNEGILLIFDEVITGFRVALGGAQVLYGIHPDLTCLGKIIGGGLPVGAFGGRAEIMDLLAPLGEVYQAGTLSGNPIAMTAGIYTLKRLQDGQLYKDLEARATLLESGICSLLKRLKLPCRFTRVASMFSIFFGAEDVYDAQSAKTSNVYVFAEYFKKMLAEGIYLPPSQFETAFLSHAHSQIDIERTLESNARVLKALESF